VLAVFLQDCKGGCFDSAAGAAGKVSVVDDQEYGPQDFFGLIEEMRVWRVVRTPEQIRQGMIADDGRGSGGSFDGPGIDKDHKGEPLLLLPLLLLPLLLLLLCLHNTWQWSWGLHSPLLPLVKCSACLAGIAV
jgi:hypothetical protein